MKTVLWNEVLYFFKSPTNLLLSLSFCRIIILHCVLLERHIYAAVSFVSFHESKVNVSHQSASTEINDMMIF